MSLSLIIIVASWFVWTGLIALHFVLQRKLARRREQFERALHNAEIDAWRRLYGDLQRNAGR